MTLAEAKAVLKVHIANRRVISGMQNRGESYSHWWSGQVNRRIKECRQVIRAHEAKKKLKTARRKAA